MTIGCLAPDACRAKGPGLCRICSATIQNAEGTRNRLAAKELSDAMKARWRNVRVYDVPGWCPPELAPLHATVLMKLKGRTKQARQLIEDHMRMHGIAAPNREAAE